MAPSLSKIFSLGWETISGIQLFSKIKRYQKISCEANEVRVTEKELENLHHKIVSAEYRVLPQILIDSLLEKLNISHLKQGDHCAS